MVHGVSLALSNPLVGAQLNKTGAKGLPTLIGVSKAKFAQLKKHLADQIPRWQWDRFESSQKTCVQFSTQNGPLWVIRPDFLEVSTEFASSDFSLGREAFGPWFRQELENHSELNIEFMGLKPEVVKGALHALVLAHYGPQKIYKTSGAKKEKLKLHLKSDRLKLTKDLVHQIGAFSVSMNLSRHLTNLPAQDLTPQGFSALAKKLLATKPQVTVEVWNEARLEKERCNLLLAVGRSGSTPPSLVRISYRPKQKSKKPPVAFVGKGVTFDSGGLNMKPASGMRLMKKDMSGAGVVLALAHFVAESRPKRAFDFYLALAENGVGQKAFRPGDVLVSRQGKTVEVHNTDAEGRLVMADAMDVAVTRKAGDRPGTLVDVSTLTGAMRVAVGTEIAGFFANDRKLADQLRKSATNVGEPVWEMPLFQPYFKKLRSSLADMTNCAEGGYGGGITAALFLKEFVGEKTSWAHFDVMAYNQSPRGAVSEGGNAQSFQLLADFISRQS